FLGKSAATGDSLFTGRRYPLSDRLAQPSVEGALGGGFSPRRPGAPAGGAHRPGANSRSLDTRRQALYHHTGLAVFLELERRGGGASTALCGCGLSAPGRRLWLPPAASPLLHVFPEPAAAGQPLRWRPRGGRAIAAGTMAPGAKDAPGSAPAGERLPGSRVRL